MSDDKSVCALSTLYSVLFWMPRRQKGPRRIDSWVSAIYKVTRVLFRRYLAASAGKILSFGDSSGEEIAPHNREDEVVEFNKGSVYVVNISDFEEP